MTVLDTGQREDYMGLDQYLYAGDEVDGTYEDGRRKGEEIGYWRKHPDLHAHIEAIWRAKGNEGEFNCVSCELTKEQVEHIIVCSHKRSFGEHDGTTGFFFGQTGDYQHEETIKIMTDALGHLLGGKKVWYSSWW